MSSPDPERKFELGSNLEQEGPATYIDGIGSGYVLTFVSSSKTIDIDSPRFRVHGLVDRIEFFFATRLERKKLLKRLTTPPGAYNADFEDVERALIENTVQEPLESSLYPFIYPRVDFIVYDQLLGLRLLQGLSREDAALAVRIADSAGGLSELFDASFNSCSEQMLEAAIHLVRLSQAEA